MIQHTRWNLQGGWKKKLMTSLIIGSAVGYIFYYTILKMSRDSFYAELEYAENMERLRKGKQSPDYNMKDIDDDTDDWTSKHNLLIQNIRHKFVFKIFVAITGYISGIYTRVGIAFKNSLRHSNSLETFWNAGVLFFIQWSKWKR